MCKVTSYAQTSKWCYGQNFLIRFQKLRLEIYDLFHFSDPNMKYASYLNDTLTTYIRLQSMKDNQISEKLESIGKKSHECQYNHDIDNYFV